MITRHFAETQIVTAFPYKSFVSCTLGTAGLTSACGGTYSGALGYTWSGFIIDRVGLAKEFNSVLIVPAAFQSQAATATSTGSFFGFDVGLQHASSTSGSWQDYSTGEWPARQALLCQTTATATSTAVTDLAPTREALALGPIAYLMTTGGTCTTTTGMSSYVSTRNMAIGLGGAQRFLRVIVRPQIEMGGTTCSAIGMDFMASLVFGDPTEGPVTPSNAIRGRVIVTSGCTTASGTST